MKILIANVGSTSLKFKLYEFPKEQILVQGKIENIGSDSSPVSYKTLTGEEVNTEIAMPRYQDGIHYLMDLLRDNSALLSDLSELSAVGFKTVFAGPRGTGPGAVELNEEVLAAMEDYAFIAPAHNPPYIEAIRLFRQELPQTPMMGLFEPAFHSSIPEEAYTYSIPREWREELHIRKYGFHGASHRYIATRVSDYLGLAPEAADNLKLISCHLGGSSSMAAILGGKSVETSMGLSPQSGVPHSNRTGDLDPFAVLYVQKRLGLSVDETAEQLCKNSGLKGLSGISGDIPELETVAEGGNDEARLALSVFVYQVACAIGALCVPLNGLEVLVFTGGIGERGTNIRSKVLAKLGYLGIELDQEKNQAAFGAEATISTPDSKVKVLVLPTNEELIVAREVRTLLEKN